MKLSNTGFFLLTLAMFLQINLFGSVLSRNALNIADIIPDKVGEEQAVIVFVQSDALDEDRLGYVLEEGPLGDMTTGEKFTILPSCLIGMIATAGFGWAESIPLLNIIPAVISIEYFGNRIPNPSIAVLGGGITLAGLAFVDTVVTLGDFIKDGRYYHTIHYHTPYQWLREVIRNKTVYRVSREMAEMFFAGDETSCGKFLGANFRRFHKGW